MENEFLELIEKNAGFEICLGFIKDEDHFIGGTGNTVWYYITKGKSQELFIGEFDGEAWKDKRITKKKAYKETETAAGSTLEKIVERIYFGQEKITKDGRKPVATKIHELNCSHYTYDFGTYAYDILDDYGVTCCYSYVDDIKVGYRFRNVWTGEDVSVPKVTKE